MSDRFHVATHKGVFTFEQSSVGWKIARVDFLGANATMLRHDPRDERLYVALAHGHFGVKLHRSSSDGTGWEECGVPAYPPLTDLDRQKQIVPQSTQYAVGSTSQRHFSLHEWRRLVG